MAHPFPYLMTDRLIIVNEVAWCKFNSGASISDPVREAEVLADLELKAKQQGIDPALVRAFFSAQMAASRQLQSELFERWKSPAAHPSRAPADLSHLRSLLDELTPRMLGCFHMERTPKVAAHAESMLREQGFSPAVIALATAPLRP